MNSRFLNPARAIGRLTACAGIALMIACAACSIAKDGQGETVAAVAFLDEPGLPRLQRVDAGLYRGGQPTSQGLRRLDDMGIRTVVSLRTADANSARRYGTMLTFVRLPMSPWRPRDEDVIAFLHIAADPAHAPVFVHCEHGSDRTGMLCAMYRVVVQGWSKDEAIAEMTRHGMGFHDVYQNLIRYVREADVERIRKALPSAHHAAGQ